MRLVGGIFGIHNHAASLVAVLALIVLGVVWLALIYWSVADARRRIETPVVVGCAGLLAVVPFIGTLVYMIVRPPEYLDDVRERELEMEAAQARLSLAGTHTCPFCDFEIEREFLCCPNCLRRLREPCASCGRPLAPEWKICPYCETDRSIDPALVRSARHGRHSTRQTMVAPPPSDFI